MSIIYKTYEIKPIPLQLEDSKEWTTAVCIAKNHGGHLNERPYTASNTFKTKNEADKHSIEYGKQIIDGKCKGLSAEDL